MITAIELENFKAFGERQRLEIRPITLLYGKNSSGKSSCIRALQMLRQTARGGRNPREVVLSGPRADVDLGSFFELVHGHDVAKTCSVSIEVADDWGSDVRIDIHIARPQSLSHAEMRDLQVCLQGAHGSWVPVYTLDDEGCLPDEQLALPDAVNEHMDNWRIGLTPLEMPSEIIARLRDAASTEAREQISGRVSWRLLQRRAATRLGADPTSPISDGEQLDRILTRFEELWKQLATTHSLNRVWQSNSRPRLRPSSSVLAGDSDFSIVRRLANVRWADLQSDIHDDAITTSHSPPRPTAESVVVDELLGDVLSGLLGRPYLAVKKCGADLSEATMIASLRDPPLRILAYEDDHAKVESDCGEVSRHLPGFGIECRLRPNRLQTGNQRTVGYELRLVPLESGDSDGDSWTDVGVGVSQIVPVIRDCVKAMGLVCVEQPELHLHPAAQSHLADFFVAMVKTRPLAREQSAPRERYGRLRRTVLPARRRIVAETHSEHLVLRLKQLVRSGEIGPQDVSLNVIETEDGEARIRRVDIDEQGRFVDPWPGGFFPERSELL